ncbi:MAG TPA: enoyl-CoA hydratase/isomerase family protein [Candidatus Bathyarchaeota archaeon]|nr:enoyl-CoA hydratase/isomerase family protein [Candidatus Bathyarchaeota archaeon]HEW89953.1 enoyl-CoA hydratase/isomerase family protein [Candidatus Bathyarchaeota archaeon]
MAEYETIKLERDEDILWIILNRPHRLNAFNDVMISELSEALDKAEEDPGVRCVIITGEGDRAFSAGADVTMFPRLTPDKAVAASRLGQEVFTKIERMSKPVIAAINGYALGGGLELAMACDFRIAAEHAELGNPEIRLGILPGWGGTQRLVRLVGLAKAKELVMLGDRIPAEEALRIRLVNKEVPFEDLRKEARALAKRLCKGPPIALKYAKWLLNFGSQFPLEIGQRLEATAFGVIFTTKDMREGIEAFMSKREPEFKGE